MEEKIKYVKQFFFVYVVFSILTIVVVSAISCSILKEFNNLEEVDKKIDSSISKKVIRKPQNEEGITFNQTSLKLFYIDALKTNNPFLSTFKFNFKVKQEKNELKDFNTLKQQTEIIKKQECLGGIQNETYSNLFSKFFLAFLAGIFISDGAFIKLGLF